MVQLTVRPPRCVINTHRVHHGPPGLLLALSGQAFRRRSTRVALRLAGAAILASDLHDWRAWLPDLIDNRTL